MTEVEEKNAKETDKVESALQRAIHITKLLIIWAARSFLYSGWTTKSKFTALSCARIFTKSCNKKSIGYTPYKINLPDRS